LKSSYEKLHQGWDYNLFPEEGVDKNEIKLDVDTILSSTEDMGTRTHEGFSLPQKPIEFLMKILVSRSFGWNERSSAYL
jgi:hypothetical protein